MIKLLHTADLHLDAPFPSLGEKEAARRNDFILTFERLLTLAIKNEVDLFLVAGDLFDSPRPAEGVVARVQAGFKRLADRGIVPVLLPGTHDNTVAADSVYRRVDFPGAVVLAAPTIAEPVSLTVGGRSVHLYGFAYRNFLSEGALAGMTRRSGPGVHIGLLHGSRQGSPEWDYRKKDLPFTLPQLKNWGLDYVALGHYHGYEILEEGGRIYACYPGSPEGKRFGENGSRYCVLASVGEGVVDLTHLSVNGRTLQETALDLSGCDDQQSAAALIQASADPDLLLRLTLTGIVEAPLDLDRLQALCGDDFFHLQLRDATRLFDSDYARRIEGEQTVRGVFVRRVRQLMEEADAEKKALVEEAFREVLVRFRAFAGDPS